MGALNRFILAAFAVLLAWGPSPAGAQAEHDVPRILGEPVNIGPIDADEIFISYKWRGLGPAVDLTYALHDTGETFVVEGTGVQVTREVILPLLAAADQQLHAVSEPLTCFDHTDDYPEFHIRLRRGGADVAEIISTSNCARYLPWYVFQDDRILVQYDGSLWFSLHALLTAVDESVWARRSRPASLFNDIAWLTLFIGRHDGPQEDDALAARLASLIGSDSNYRRRFGEVTPEIANVRCEAIAHPDCSVLDLSVTVPRPEGWAFSFKMSIDGEGPASYELPDARNAAAFDAFIASTVFTAIKNLAASSPLSVRFGVDTSRYLYIISQGLQLDQRTQDLARKVFIVSTHNNAFELRFYPELGKSLVVSRYGTFYRAAFLDYLGAGQETQDDVHEDNVYFLNHLNGSVEWFRFDVDEWFRLEGGSN